MYVKPPNFHQLMQCTLYLQYIGFSFPIFTIRNNKTLVVKEVSSWLELTTLSILAIVETCLIIRTQNDEQGINVFSILTNVVNFTSILFMVVGGWEVKTKSQLMKSVFDKIKALDETAKLENNQMNSLTVQVMIWSSAIITTTAMCVIPITIYDSQFHWKLLAFTTILRLYAVPAIYLVQFFTLITLVRYYLEYVDKQLGKIRQSKLKEKEECKTYMSFRPHFRDAEDCKTANDIENIRKIYGRVHSLKQDINEVYNMRIWMDTIGTALKILYFIYFNLIILKRSKENILDGYYLKQYYLHYWIVFLTLKFLENIRICGKVTACGKNIGIKVHEIFSSSYCESVRNELTTFSLELLHRDPRVKANNVFVIDYPLTASFVRGIVMQLIALFQINLPDIQSDFRQNFFGSEPANITSQMLNNSALEEPATTILNN